MGRTVVNISQYREFCRHCPLAADRYNAGESATLIGCLLCPDYPKTRAWNSKSNTTSSPKS